MPTSPPTDQLPARLDEAATAIEALRTQWRTVARIGTHERIALAQLEAHGAMPMSELAARIALSRAAVTSLVDRLEAERWVERAADVRDRRRTVVRLSQGAQSALDAIAREFHEDIARWGAALPGEQRAVLLQLLGQVTSIAQQHADALRATAAERALEEPEGGPR